MPLVMHTITNGNNSPSLVFAENATPWMAEDHAQQTRQIRKKNA